MGITKSAAHELVEDMNLLVFKKIREELIRNTERKKIFVKSVSPLVEKEGTESGNPKITTSASPFVPNKEEKNETGILGKAGIEIIPTPNTISIADIGEGKKDLLPEIMPTNLPANMNREDMLQKIEKPELINKPVIAAPAPSIQKEEVHPLLAQKLTSSVQIPAAKTEHTLENITKTVPSSYPPKKDPYRLSPDE